MTKYLYVVTFGGVEVRDFYTDRVVTKKKNVQQARDWIKHNLRSNDEGLSQNK